MKEVPKVTKIYIDNENKTNMAIRLITKETSKIQVLKVTDQKTVQIK